MYVLPQEIEVWYILPSIRKELAKQLVKTHKLSYEKAGSLLGVSKAAVSQYISNKRANKIVFPGIIKKEIKKSADIITKDGQKAIREIERILTLIKKTKCSCSVCKKYNPGIIKFCNCNPLY